MLNHRATKYAPKKAIRNWRMTGMAAIVVRRRAFLAGLSVSGTAIGNTFTHPPGPDRDREIAYTRLWIDRAADMGAPTIRIFAGDVQKGTTEAQARQWCIDAIREYLQVKSVWINTGAATANPFVLR